MYEWCLQEASVMSRVLSSPPLLVTWPGWESEEDVTCYFSQTGWWLEDCWLELWSSSVHALPYWLAFKHMAPADISNFIKVLLNIRHLSLRRSCSRNMDGQKRNQSRRGIARCSWRTKWMTTRQKARGLSHLERLTESNKLESHKTPFSQVE